MAIRYDPRLYTAGTAVFNPEPITRASEYVARYKQAKNEALDQYYQKRGDSINGEGMRNQDLPEFQKKIGQLKDYYLVNKDRLRKGDVMAQSNYEKLFRDTQGLVQQSKERTAAREEALKTGLELRKEGGTVPDSFLQDLHLNDLPIGDEKGKRFDATPYIAEPKPFDIAKHLKAYEDVPRTPGLPQIGETDPKTGKRVVTETEQFDDNAKNTIALRAGSSYQNDRSFQREVNKTTANPDSKKQLEEVFKSQFGKAPDEPEDYATAYILAQKQLAKTTQKLEDDKDWARAQEQKNRLDLEAVRNRNAVARDAMKAARSKDLALYRNKLKGLDKKEQDSVVDNTFEDIKADAIKNGKWHHTVDGKKTGEYYMTKIPNSVRAEFGKKNENGKLEYPNEVAFNDDDTVDILFFKEGQVGDKKAIDAEKSHKITQNEFKATIGKKLFGTKTTSGATYYGEDENDEEDNGGEEGVIVPVGTQKKPVSAKKKIPGF